MGPVAPEEVIARVLWHLSKNLEKTCWSGTYLDSELAKIAWHTVDLAWSGSLTPSADAFKKIQGDRLEREAQLIAMQEAYVPPPPSTYAEIDGRNAHRWHKSIMRYLEWRIASVEEQFVNPLLQEEVQILARAKFMVNQAYTSNAPVVLWDEVHANDLQRTKAQECAVPAASDRSAEELGVLHERLTAAGNASHSWHCRGWQHDRRADLRAARGCRAPYEFPAEIRTEKRGRAMTADKLQSEYCELLASNVAVPLLKECLQAKLAAIARKEYGRNDLVAKALGTHAQTISRWTVAGRTLQIAEQLQATVNRIAQALFDAELHAESVAGEMREDCAADRIIGAFETGLANVAVERAGNKKAAARLLGVHRNWVLKYAAKSGRTA